MNQPALQPDGWLRPITWSLAGFLLGLIFTPIPREAKSVVDIWVVSFMVGCFYMAIAFIIALSLNRRLGPTKTVLPFYNTTRKQEWLFSLGLGFSLILRSIPSYGAIYVMLAALPILVVLRGNR